MRYALIIALVVICVIGVAGVAYFAGRVYDTPDPLAAQKLELDKLTLTARIERLRIEQEAEKRKTAVTLATLTRQRRIAAARPVETAEIALAVFRRTLPMIALTLAVVGATGYYALRKIPFEYGEVKTYLPARAVPLMTERALIVAGLSEQARIAAYEETLSRARVADAALLFKSLRSGRETTHITQETPAQAALPASESQPASVTFERARHDFRTGDMLLGYDATGAAIYLPLTSFVSCAFGGGSGSGKTSKLRFLVAQLILQGVKVSILDAHAGNEQSLVDSLGALTRLPNVRVFPPFETRQAVEAMLSDVQAAIDAGTPADAPSVFVLDELRPLTRACGDVETLMDKLANEGRKYNQFGVFSSQTWEAKMFAKSGSAARDACVLKMAAKMPREQAKTLFKDGSAARTVARLQQPEMYADGMTFSGVVTVPFCSRQDLDRLGAGVKQAGAGTTQAVKPSVDTGADVDAPEANVGADVIDFAARREQRGNTTPTVSLTKQPDTGALPPLPQDALAAQLREYLQTQDMSLSKFADAAGVNKGLLSVFLRGEKRLSEAMMEKVTAAMRGETREVTTS